MLADLEPQEVVQRVARGGVFGLMTTFPPLPIST